MNSSEPESVSDESGIEDELSQLARTETVVESSGGSGGGVSEPQEGPVGAQSQPVVDNSVLEAISSLGEEVKNLKENLSRSLEELRSSIATLKSDVDEVRNPFNYMRSIAEFLDEDTRNAILALANMMGLRSEGVRSSEVKVLQVPSGLGAQQVSLRDGRDNLLDFLELLLWLDSIYDTREWGELKDLLGTLSGTRILPEGKLRMLRTAIDLVEKSRVKGEKVSSKARLLYILARQLGVTSDRSARVLEFLLGEK